MKEQQLQAEIYLQNVLEHFRASSGMFVPNASRSASSVACAIRDNGLLSPYEKILTLDGEAGYVYIDNRKVNNPFAPGNFRMEPDWLNNTMYAEELHRAFSFMQLVQILDEVTATPIVKKTVFEDFLYFVGHQNQFISLKAFADDTCISLTHAENRVRKLQKSLSVANTGIGILTMHSHGGHRLTRI